MRDIEYILSQDPRPAYQDDPQREYKMDYGGYKVTFVVEGKTVKVREIAPPLDLFYDRPLDARSGKALHPTREGKREAPSDFPKRGWEGILVNN